MIFCPADTGRRPLATPKTKTMPDPFDDKKARLIDALKRFDRLAVALSGGVDSALLLSMAREVLGQQVIAVTARSPIHPREEVADAAAVARGLGIPHFIVDTDEMAQADFIANPPRRCYICKKIVFNRLLHLIREKGIEHLAHGANADDMADYRPGLQAAAELGVAAPLLDAGMTKDDIRRLAGERGLHVWNKPAMACYATRIPYGTPIDDTKVAQIEQAEAVLVDLGFAGGRIRHHGDVARIEVPLDRIEALVAAPLRGQVAERLKAIGFLHVCVDLEGYVSGSMNRVLKNG